MSEDSAYFETIIKLLQKILEEIRLVRKAIDNLPSDLGRSG